MGGDREYFVSSLYEWNVDDYRGQWRDALVQLVNGRDRVGLITSYVSPSHSSYLNWWILYRNQSEVIIQSQVLFYNQLPNAFSLENLHSYIFPRASDELQENVVSEWSVSILDVQDFLANLERTSNLRGGGN